MLIDTHCHLNYPGLVEDQAGALARARAAGVTFMICIGTKEAEWPDVQALAEREKDVAFTVGAHPHEAQTHVHVDQNTLRAAADHPRCVGIGECGLDYYYGHSPRAVQQQSFRTHIATAREMNLPLVIHTRDAEEDTIAILQEECAQGGVRGVIHCFTASAEFAKSALDLGFYISFSGILTFKSAKSLQETAAWIPSDRLLIETDAPFLSPVPMRGQPCEPAFVVHTARFLAQLRGMEEGALHALTARNALTLFHKVPGLL